MADKYFSAAYKRTVIYMDTHAVPEYVKELKDMGFDVILPEGGLLAELVRLTLADIVIIIVPYANRSSWVKAGFAKGCGMQVIAVGSSFRDDEADIFSLVVPAWADLSRNKFLLLGDGHWKKEKPLFYKRRKA